MALIQSLVSSDKYGVKCPYVMTPKGICVHNTANDASAKNEIAYMKSNNNEVSFHVAIDDVEAIQAIPFNRNAWAAGDGGNGNGNRNYIHVEICYSKSGGTKFINAEKRAAKEVASLLKQFGWGIDKIKKHQDFSGKYCPHRTLDMGWQRFLNMIQAELNGTAPTTNTSKPNGDLCRILVNGTSKIALTGLQKCIDYVKTNYSKDEVKIQRVSDNAILWTQAKYIAPVTNNSTDEVRRYAENGVFYPNTTIYFRNAPNTSSNNPTQGTYTKGESVKYDTVVIGNRYNWISWISASTGVRRYMPIKDKQTGESWGYAV